MKKAKFEGKKFVKPIDNADKNRYNILHKAFDDLVNS